MKKVLAWAVVLALVLSSFTMAFADQAKTSKDFSDASSIQYTEAVDVMVATGVINGYPDGTFGPAKTVKRSEMAKMISVMLEGGEDIGDQYKGACPFADSKNHWAAGYIAYCSAEHIIDGRSADVFDPEAEVTGTEVAKMALTSLGYDSKIQGYTGENWAAAVLKDAKKNNLFEGLKDFTPGDPCSREAAAQILFNTLKATMVEYDNGTSVSVGDNVNVVVSSKIKDQTWPGTDLTANPKKYDKKDDNQNGTKQLYEEVFGGDLKNAPTTDNGDPAHKWTFGKDEVGVYPDTADYTFTAEDSMTFEKALKKYDSSLADKFFKSGKEEYKVSQVYYNGSNTLGEGALSQIKLGDSVELFDLGTKSTVGTKELADYRVVITHYEAAQITAVETELSKKELDAEHTAKLTLTAAGDSVDFYDDEIAGYDKSTYVKDAVIAVAANGSEIIDSYVLKEMANGEVSEFKGSASAPDSITIDGTAYTTTEDFVLLDNANIDVKKEYALYDYNGFAIASLKTADNSVTYYGVVTAVGGKAADDFGKPGDAKLMIVTAEGEETPFVVNADYAKESGYPYKSVTTAGSITPELVSYKLNDNNEITNIAKKDGGNLNGQNMKSGQILYGKEVSNDVVAFGKSGDDWVVYDVKALEAADAVNIAEFKNDGSKMAAILLTGNLEESTSTLGLVTKVEPITNGEGAAYKITAYVEGKEVTYTTKKANDDMNAFAAHFAQRDKQKEPATLAKFELDGDLVKAVSVAKCVGVNKAGEEFPKYDGTNKFDAVFYVGYNGTPGGEVATLSRLPIQSKDGTSLDVGATDYIDFQAVTGPVYYVNENGELEESSFSAIKKTTTVEGQVTSGVVLINTNEKASGWNIVIYGDSDSWKNLNL